MNAQKFYTKRHKPQIVRGIVHTNTTPAGIFVAYRTRGVLGVATAPTRREAAQAALNNALNKLNKSA